MFSGCSRLLVNARAVNWKDAKVGKNTQPVCKFAAMPVQVSKEKIEFFQQHLLAWYQKNGRKFPWRKKGLTHYQYVIAEVLLQRTKAETVSRFYVTFIRDFPNWEALSSADVKEIETYLIPIGLYRQRSKRLM